MAVDDYDDNDVGSFARAFAGVSWVRENPAAAVELLLETGALEQCGWRFQAKRPSGLGYRYSFMTYIEGEAGHHGHEPVYRVVSGPAPSTGDTDA